MTAQERVAFHRQQLRQRLGLVAQGKVFSTGMERLFEDSDLVVTTGESKESNTGNRAKVGRIRSEPWSSTYLQDITFCFSLYLSLTHTCVHTHTHTRTHTTHACMYTCTHAHTHTHTHTPHTQDPRGTRVECSAAVRDECKREEQSKEEGKTDGTQELQRYRWHGEKVCRDSPLPE